MKLELERNPRNLLDINLQLPSGAVLMMTAPLPAGCWLFRVRLAENLTLLAVPQFGGVSVRVQSSPACHASVPCEHEAAHILQAFGNCVTQHSIAAGQVLDAIRMLQVAVKEWRCGGVLTSP